MFAVCLYSHFFLYQCVLLWHTLISVDVRFPERLRKGFRRSTTMISYLTWNWLQTTDLCLMHRCNGRICGDVSCICRDQPELNICRIWARAYSLRSYRQWTRTSQLLTYISQHQMRWLWCECNMKCNVSYSSWSNYKAWEITGEIKLMVFPIAIEIHIFGNYSPLFT